MLRAMTPLRSVLFVPAANARAVEKSATLACDAVILDLEDSVAPEQKEAARERAASASCAAPGSRMRAIRINGPDSEWVAHDIVAAARLPGCAVVLPKVSTAQDVHRARAALTAAGGANPLWAMIETPLGVLNLKEIAAEARETGLEALIAGPNDLSAALGLPPKGARAGLSPYLAQIVLAARAFGLMVLDGVYNDFTDAEGFAADARHARALGFDGKTLIHPSQIDAANAIFAPSEAELDWARRVTAAFAAPEAAGRTAIRMGGEMLETMHLARARAMLARGAAPRAK
jgi:citrate lyase subunit beta/citryl-CoA lyase